MHALLVVGPRRQHFNEVVGRVVLGGADEAESREEVEGALGVAVEGDASLGKEADPWKRKLGEQGSQPWLARGRLHVELLVDLAGRLVDRADYYLAVARQPRQRVDDDLGHVRI
jgi:hypothetical protein